MPSSLNKLTIGALATESGVNVETIRFYQRKHLLPEPERLHGSIRRYGAHDLSRIRFIKSAKRLGFTLDEIGQLLQLADGTHCRQAKGMAELKLADVRQKLVDLNGMESVLADLVARCDAGRGKLSCPLIASLQRDLA